MSQFVEALEERRHLSITLSDPTTEFLQHSAGIEVNALAIRVGSYQGRISIFGESGMVLLKVTSISGGRISGTLSSAAWGGFRVAVSGTLSTSRKMQVSGSSTTCRIKSFAATLGTDGKTLYSSLSLSQMQVAGSGTGKVVRTASPVAMPAPTVAKLVGRYRVNISDGNRTTLTISKQTGGLLWGSESGGSSARGFIAAGNKMRMRLTAGDGYTLIRGTFNSSGTSGSGVWSWYGKDGDRESGTWTMTKL
jgi:hypothetical protein